MTQSPDTHNPTTDGSARHACNINSRGKILRLVAGMMLMLLAIMLTILVIVNMLTGTVGWWLAAVTFLSGGFLVYEGWAGWCALRAMGISTPV